MRSIARTFLVAFVISGLLNFPANAAAKPLGMVVAAENAHLGGTKLSMGTNVFPGDSVQTDAGGTLRLRVGPTQVYLASESAAVLEQTSDKIGATLSRGTVGFSSAQANQFEVETPVATVRPAAGSAFGEVTLVGQHTILVAAYRGSLLVSANGVERTISEGNSFSVTFVPDGDSSSAAQDQQGGGTDNDNGNGKQKRSTQYGVTYNGQIVFTAIFIGLAAGGAYAAWHYATESNPNPTQ